jgi:hypothetical protein
MLSTLASPLSSTAGVSIHPLISHYRNTYCLNPNRKHSAPHSPFKQSYLPPPLPPVASAPPPPQWQSKSDFLRRSRSARNPSLRKVHFKISHMSYFTIQGKASRQVIFESRKDYIGGALIDVDEAKDTSGIPHSDNATLTLRYDSIEVATRAYAAVNEANFSVLGWTQGKLYSSPNSPRTDVSPSGKRKESMNSSERDDGQDIGTDQDENST